jgi:hypothetical protein
MLTIKDLSARQELDRAAMGAVAGGTGLPGFALTNTATDLFDILGAASQVDYTSIANVGNHGSLVLNIVDNDKDINV